MANDRFKNRKFIKWAKEIKVNDCFTCKICDKRGVYLHAHHIYSWDKYEDLRFDLSNGVTLCEPCHTRFHDNYGYGNNTSFQFEEYKEIAEIFKEILRIKE